MYAGFLSFNETLLFHIATKLLSNICGAYSLVLIYTLYSLFCCLVALH